MYTRILQNSTELDVPIPGDFGRDLSIYAAEIQSWSLPILQIGLAFLSTIVHLWKLNILIVIRSGRPLIFDDQILQVARLTYRGRLSRDAPYFNVKQALWATIEMFRNGINHPDWFRSLVVVEKNGGPLGGVEAQPLVSGSYSVALASIPLNSSKDEDSNDIQTNHTDLWLNVGSNGSVAIGHK